MKRDLVRGPWGAEEDEVGWETRGCGVGPATVPTELGAGPAWPGREFPRESLRGRWDRGAVAAVEDGPGGEALDGGGSEKI